MSNSDYLHFFRLAAPQAILLIGALLVLFMDLSSTKKSIAQRSSLAGVISVFTLIAAIAWVAFVPGENLSAHGLLVVTPLTRLVSEGLLYLTLFTVLFSIKNGFTNHVGEFFGILLMSAVGMITLVSTHDLLVLFIALELVSLSLYVLTAFNKNNIYSSEAALKYYLFGSIAAAFTLFGLSLLFGIAGGTNFNLIASHLAMAKVDALVIVAMIMTALGFAFKVAAAPLHLWAPNTYQGAPIPSAAFIASASKLASFFIFFMLFSMAFKFLPGSAERGHFLPGIKLMFAIFAGASIVAGNLLAIGQQNIRKLIAYSAVAHSGYALFALLGNADQGLPALLYYVFTYALSVIGIFALIGMVEKEHGEALLSDFAGFSKKEPALALALMIFVLSLAGIPPLSGFFGKFYLFAAAAKGSLVNPTGHLWLIAIALAGSAVSVYYYLQILKQAYVVSPSSDQNSPIIATDGVRAAIGILAVLILVLGCFPNLLLSRINSAIASSGPVPITQASK